MRKTNDTFVPSKVLDDIYDIIDESICVAGNEDVYFDDIIWPIVRLLDEHPHVRQFLWEDYRDSDNEGGILFISWIEGDNQLRHEHFKYVDFDEEINYDKGKRDTRQIEHPDGPCADFFCF